MTFTNELEDTKAIAVYRVSLGQKVSAVCDHNIFGTITGHKIDDRNRIVLTGENEKGEPWQSVKPQHIF